MGDYASPISLEQVGAALAALSALATAAFGLLDASKGLWGGIARVGLGHIWRALAPFQSTLNAAMGESRWRILVEANWMNGMAKTEQKAVVRSLIKLGLNEATARDLAAAVRVDPEALLAIAKKLAKGAPLSETDLNLLGRLNAVLDALLDSGFEMADQQYRNVSRLWAGILCVILSLSAWGIWFFNPQDMKTTCSNFWIAIAVGVLAVPVAPVAKDLTSSLTAAAKALKLGRP